MNVSRIVCTWILILAAASLAVPALAEEEELSPLFTRARAIAEREGYTAVTTDALRQMLREAPDALLVDVRFSYEYSAGHIPGAVNMPIDLADRGDIPIQRRLEMENVLGPDRGRPIIIYCRDFR